MINIILCGGSGTRLWPVSRELMPKQFAKIIGKTSLFQETLNRNSNFCGKSLIVSNQSQYFLALDQSEEIGFNDNMYLLESEARNTAPAIALACLALDSDDIVIVTPSDHLIVEQEKYITVVEKAKKLANENFLVTFGIKPDSPNTGFGYIEANNDDVISFKEKPSFDKAKEYLKKGNFYWNSGMFVFKAGIYLNELKKYAPDIYKYSKIAFENSKSNSGPIRIPKVDMHNIPKNSIDYAVMEKSNMVKVVAADIGWSDLGSFDALYDELPKDVNGNTKSNAIHINSKNNLILGASNRKIATIDVDDLILIDTPDALLLSKKDSSQKVKSVVELLKKEKSNLITTPLTVNRPWGTYTVLEAGTCYKIKKIVVKLSKRLSLQKHYHRNEHWIVIEGTAKVQIGEESKIIRENESIYIPMGVKHRLENPGKIDLKIIEVQVGNYLEEDDIVRYDDDFERK